VDGIPYRVALREGASAESLAPALDKLSAGKDRSINIARDGSVLVLDTERFGCTEWSCLAIVQADLSFGHAVRAGGGVVRTDGPAAVGPHGNIIVYSGESRGTGHNRDLFAIRREGKGHGRPRLLTADSAHAYNGQPELSPDGKRVVFDCGPDPYQGKGTGVCEVGVDGTGFRQVVMPGSGVGKDVQAFHGPSYAPDGSIVVEADKAPEGERLWRIDAAGSSHKVLSKEFPNDNSPCVAPDGRVVSLWLGRRGGKGTHEVKVMTPDGSQHFMATLDTDAADVVLGCGASSQR
jgi:Tol biopolymer transport system component